MCNIHNASAKLGRVALLTEQNELVVLDLNTQSLDARLADWKRMIHGSGGVSEGPLTIEYDGKKHHGGNTWAGGTGGADTAGLGGKGGPYRLDKGFDVYQISEEQKQNISKEAEEAARQMNREAYAKRLQEIEMS